MKVAAIQLVAELGNVDRNLETCAQLGRKAGAAGAELIVLPEFFSSGVAYDDKVLGSERPADGEPLVLLQDIAKQYDALAGGSFLCQDDDGHVRNAFFLVSPAGVIGRHDKDIPTMWENCFYVGGDDNGRIEHEGTTYGVALCWEFLRSATSQRLRGSVDVVIGGSCVWGAPDKLLPRWIRGALDTEVDAWSGNWASIQARTIGAPVVEAAHAGTLVGRAPWLGFEYRSRLRGGAKVCAADGSIRASIDADRGNAVVLAEIEPGGVSPSRDLPPSKYVTHVSPMVRVTQAYQTIHGKRWYRRKHPQAPAIRTMGIEY